MLRRTHVYWRLLTILLAILAMSVVAFAESAEEITAQGRFWYESGGEDDEKYSMDLEIVDGIAVGDDLMGGERVKVLLVGNPLDQEKFAKVFAEKGVLMFTTMDLRINESVTFDVCRNEDGSDVEICGIHFSGPGLSKSSSGFGVYDHFTESVDFADGRVSAKLKTTEPETEGSVTWGFDLSFDVPILPKPEKKE